MPVPEAAVARALRQAPAVAATPAQRDRERAAARAARPARRAAGGRRDGPARSSAGPAALSRSRRARRSGWSAAPTRAPAGLAADAAHHPARIGRADFVFVFVL